MSALVLVSLVSLVFGQVVDNCGAANASWSAPSDSLHELCDRQGRACQWACAVFNCTRAYPPQVVQRFNPAVAGSCAHVVSAAPNETLCVRRGGPISLSTCPSWFLSADDLPRSAWIEVGFARAVFASHVLVLESVAVGFVTRVQVFDNATGNWLTGFDGAERNKTVDEARARVAAFPVPNHVLTARVRLFINATLSTDRVNGIVLVGGLTQPAPTPPTGPPTPYPSLPALPSSSAAACKPRAVQWDETVDVPLGDHLCDESDDPNIACAFPCSLLSCSWTGDEVEYCRSLVGDSQHSIYDNWTPSDARQEDWIALDFGGAINATSLIIGHSESDIVDPVISIERVDTGRALFSNGSDGETVNRTVPRFWVYPLRDAAGRNLRQLNITLWPFAQYSLRFVRLRGTVATPLPRRELRFRLEGRFRAEQVPLAPQIDVVTERVVGRFDLLAPQAPPPMLESKAWLGAGRYNDRLRQLSGEIDWFDLCDFKYANYSTAAKPCEVWNGELAKDDNRALPSKIFHVQGALVRASTDVTVAVFGTSFTDSVLETVPPQYRVFGSAQPWTKLAVSEERARGCLMAFENVVYYAGGVHIDDSRNLRKSIEVWTFEGERASEVTATNRLHSYELSRSRGAPGCAVWSFTRQLVVVGGFTWSTRNLGSASDVVDFIPIGGGESVRSTRMPREVIAPSVAAVERYVIVAAGAPRPRLNDGIDAGDSFADAITKAYNMARDPGGVMIFDRFSQQWSFSPNTLSPLLWNQQDNILPMRVAVPLNERFIAVVGGEVCYSHDGSVDERRIGEESFTSPIDIFDAERGIWFLKAAQHHGGMSFSVISSVESDRLVVAGGFLAQGYESAHAIATEVIFTINTDIDVDCDEINTCAACVVDKYKQRCRWCATENTNITCIDEWTPCDAPVVTLAAECPTPRSVTETNQSTTASTQSVMDSMDSAPTRSTNTMFITQTFDTLAAENRDWAVFGAVIGAIVGTLVVCALVGLAIFLYRRYAKRGAHLTSVESTTEMASARKHYAGDEVDSTDEKSNNSSAEDDKPQAGATMSRSLSDIENKYLIDEKDLKRGKKLGQGAFGAVYAAKWRNTTVAVKEILNVGDEKQKASFADEMVAMCRLQPHTNVIQLFGVVVGDSLAIVTEFAPGGSLDEWLLKGDGKTAPVSTLQRIASECAAGLAHLHAQKPPVVHRDIAARNVLLGHGLTAKIADFGMSRSAEETDAVDGENRTKTTVGPLRYMAPEAMRKLVYSPASDAFSFGVLVWEIFERGKTPWGDVSVTEAATKVINGKRLKFKKSTETTRVVREIVDECFKTNPKQRPTMADAAERLSSFDESDSAETSVEKPSTEYSLAPPASSNGEEYASTQYTAPPAAAGYSPADGVAPAGGSSMRKYAPADGIAPAADDESSDVSESE
jgi:serine/threonine protein kinase